MSAAPVTISGRVSLLQPTAVNSILKEIRAAQANGVKIVSLMRGEPDFRTPGHIVEAAKAALAAGRTGYPDNRGEDRLRRAVAKKLASENGVDYDPDSEVLVTTGATFGIYAALMALLEPGQQVLVPDPVYDAYRSPIRLAGAEPRPVHSEIHQRRFRITRSALEEAWTPSARALLLNTPWNPTGTVLRRDELHEIAEFVESRNLILISDEIYEALTYEDAKHVSPASISPYLRSRTILVNSFSKTYAMTGWRVGYCAGPPQTIAAMYLVLQQSSRGPATFVQDAAAAALEGPQDCVRSMLAEYARRRELVQDTLSGVAGAECLPPEGGFFTMLDIRACGVSSDKARRHLLNRHNVAVVNGSAYGAAGEGTLRVSFASGGETLTAGLQKLREGLVSL